MGVTVAVSVIALAITWWRMGKARKQLKPEADDNKRRVRAAQALEGHAQHLKDVEAAGEKIAQTQRAQSDSETETESEGDEQPTQGSGGDARRSRRGAGKLQRARR